LLDFFAPCDVVIGHNFFTLHKNLALTSAVYRLSQTRSGPPWVAWHHDFAWLRPQYQSELHPGEPWDLLRRSWSDVFQVTVSEAQRLNLAQLTHLSPDEISVISPGVEPLAFYRTLSTVRQLVERWNLLDADCVFLLPARITRRKNIELGLRWLAAVRRLSGWDARLVITGPPGPHNPTNVAYLTGLETLQTELHLQDAVHFVHAAGYTQAPLLLAEEELADLYQIADAMIFPSKQEGFGIPILEAEFDRLPVFAVDLPPFHESAGANATLFSADASPDQVGGKIIEVLQAHYAFQLRRRVLTKYTWLGITKHQILPLLQKAIDHKRWSCKPFHLPD
jgi:glycosyltransferase involved in cell wall biosynthesis